VQHDVARTPLADFPYGLRVSEGRDKFSERKNVESYCFLLRRTVYTICAALLTPLPFLGVSSLLT
jgi:hypothetical protein